jgi:hypothetical protein
MLWGVLFAETCGRRRRVFDVRAGAAHVVPAPRERVRASSRGERIPARASVGKPKLVEECARSYDARIAPTLPSRKLVDPRRPGRSILQPVGGIASPGLREADALLAAAEVLGCCPVNLDHDVRDLAAGVGQRGRSEPRC